MALSPSSPVIQYNITSGGYSTPEDACASLNVTTPVYTQAENNPPMAGMIFYSDESLINKFIGGIFNQWYLLEKDGTTWAARVDTQGVLLDYRDCVTQVTPTQTTTQTPTQTPSKTPTQTPTQTSTQTSTPTNTPTYTPTPTSTPQNTPSNTQTPTNTPTPSTTPIGCGVGLTTGPYFYTDCCGNLISGTDVESVVSIDYRKAYNGIALAFESTSVVCPTPTETPTQTVTPTPSITPSFTPSPTTTQTPTPTTTLTPTSQEVYVRQNDCDVVTLFPLGVVCNVVNPSSSTSFDGVVSVLITGGTSPYTIVWDNGQIGQTIAGLPGGNYGVSVVDYYQDYTASTICSIFAASPTPTASQTATPTPTVTPDYANLCFFVDYKTGTINGPLQFTRGAAYNGRPSWQYFNGVSTTYLRWNIEQGKWEMQDWTIGQGTLVNYTNTYFPLTGWQSVGNPVQAVVQVTEGTCPQYPPLQATFTTDPTTCGNTQPCDGDITITVQGGRAPYTYSINDGQTFSSSNIFSQLCEGTYTVVIKDSIGNTLKREVVVIAEATPALYEISVSTSGVTQVTNNNYTGAWAVEINPPLPIGASITFDLYVDKLSTVDGPGTGSTLGTTIVYKNGTELTRDNITINSSTISRPNCDGTFNGLPIERTQVSTAEVYKVTMVRGTIVSGITNSILSITTGAVATNGCATRLEQNINVLAFSPVVSNCKCCNVTALKVAGGIPEHILTYTESEPTPDPQYPPSFLSSAYASACDACEARLMVSEVYTYRSLSPALDMLFYNTKQNTVLTNPFNGQGLFYKFTWGGEDPTDFDVVQISSGGVVTNLLDCETNCGSILNSYIGSGYGDTISGAGNDATLNNRTLYSDCNSLSFGPLCFVYTDSNRTPLTGFNFVFINGSTYSINPSNGVISGYTPEQN
jgi:hypothetical protein